MKDRYDHTGRLRLEIAGDPKWVDYEKQGRLDLWYDETDSTFRASQPVTVPDDARDTPLADEKAALDIGANNLVACTTTTGEQHLYEGRDVFNRFRETMREIARLQSKLREGRYSSERIERLIENGPVTATTPKKRYVVTCWNDCTPRVWTRCISVA